MEIGWRLARFAWGQGYATEGARRVVHAAFDELALAELWSMTAAANTPSQAVMRRTGMTFVRQFDHPGVAADRPLRPHVFHRLARAGDHRPPQDRQKSATLRRFP